jgi:hypothetical protein
VKKWTGSPIYSFCDNIESANHSFFSCDVAKGFGVFWVPVWVLVVALETFGKDWHGCILTGWETRIFDFSNCCYL